MKPAKLILVAALTLFLAGCVLSGKPKVPPPATAPVKPAVPPPTPEPLSTPQTQVSLPAYQPVNQKALETAPPIEPAPVPEQAAAAPVPKSSPPKPQPAKPSEPTPAAAPPVVETARTPIQEVLPTEESTRLQTSAQRHKAEIVMILAKAQHRRLNSNEQNMVVNINQFVRQSDQAENSKDMRSADEFAQKAYILAKELQGGQ